MPTIAEGDAFPDFDLPADAGSRVSLAALKGKPFVLYVYPKATPPAARSRRTTSPASPPNSPLWASPSSACRPIR
jgi:peroxiredoxin